MKKSLNYLIFVLVIVLLVLCYLFFFDNNKVAFNIIDNNFEIEKDGYGNINYQITDQNIPIIWKSMDESIATVDNYGTIKGINYGITTIYGIANINNQEYRQERIVTVYQGKKNSLLQSVVLPEGELFLTIGKTFQLPIEFMPNDAYVSSIDYLYDKNNIIEVKHGIIKGLNEGKSTLLIKVNNQVSRELIVNVLKDETESGFYDVNKKINLVTKSIWLKVGNSYNIKEQILRNNKNDILSFKTNDSSIIDVSSNGIITAKSTGTAHITISLGNNKEELTIQVNPQVGLVNGTGGIWGYVSHEVYNPVRANIDFFNNLTSQGIGTINNNIFTYNDNGITYSYDISKSKLTCNGNSILMRIYYPLNKNLSELNTFTFLGGIGETNFDGYFSKIEQDTSIIKSRGIVILVTVSRKDESYNVDGVISGTNFVRAIIKQKEKAINSVAGYSKGGPGAADAIERGDYQRLMIVNSYFDKVYGRQNLLNKEIYIYSVNNDDMKRQTLEALNYMNNVTYNNVTIISNNPEIYNKYSNKYLVINPGTLMGSGHGSQNITNSNLFMFANE